jgi:hypothetical protein
MEFINANLINLELELNLNKSQTVFSAASLQAAATVASLEAEAKAVEATVSSNEVKQEAAPVATVAIPPLAHLQESRGWITEEKFTKRVGHNSHPLNGPTYESNWLLPMMPGSTAFGSLCVGSYPESCHGYLARLLNAGCNTFVCLNDEYGTQDHRGDYYEPYARNNRRIPADRFIHKKIKDMNIGDDMDLLEVCNEVVKRIKNGENVYLHCAGGHGRTGGYAAIILHKLYPELTSSEIFEYIQFAHDQRDGHACGTSKWTKSMLMDPWAHHFKASQVPSPQTLDQRNQVRSLMREQLYR